MSDPDLPVASSTSTPSLPLGPGVTVLARHRAGLLALLKPGGVLAHPNRRSEASRSLLTCPYDEESQVFGNGAERWHLLHRLDSGTSGVVLLATDASLASAVRTAFAEGRVEKHYRAIVKGTPRPHVGTWADRLEKSRTGATVRSRAGQGIAAVTRYRWLQSDANGIGLSDLELRPQTGRTHQLRVQCEQHGCPVLGDKTYGDFKWNRRVFAAGLPERLYLHAERIELNLEWEGGAVSFSVTAPLPETFAAIFERSHEWRNRWRSQPSDHKTPELAWQRVQRKLKDGIKKSQQRGKPKRR